MIPFSPPSSLFSFLLSFLFLPLLPCRWVTAQLDLRGVGYREKSKVVSPPLSPLSFFFPSPPPFYPVSSSVAVAEGGGGVFFFFFFFFFLFFCFFFPPLPLDAPRAATRKKRPPSRPPSLPFLSFSPFSLFAVGLLINCRGKRINSR